VRASLRRFGLACLTAVRSSSGSAFVMAMIRKATSLSVRGAADRKAVCRNRST
jgi:hypothetical protein